MMLLFAMLFSACLVAFSQNTGYIDIYVLISIVIVTVAFFYDIQKITVYRKYIVSLSLGYLFRILLLFYDVYTDNPLHLPLVGGALSSDPLRFFNAAIGYTQGISTSYGGFFPKLLGMIFSLTGISRLWAEFIVLLFSVFTILVFVKIIDDMNVPLVYRRASVYLIGLLPNYAFLSAILRRETLITFFVSLSIRCFINWLKGSGGGKSFALAFAFALGASIFHGATGLIVVSYIFVRIFYSPTKKTYGLKVRNLIGALAFLGIFLYVYARFGTLLFDKVESKLSAGSFSSTRDAGGSSYAEYVGDASTPLRMLIFSIPRLLYFMFSPFPWQWRDIGDIITFLLSSCIYLYIVINSFRYIRVTARNEENRNIVIGLLLVLLISSMFFSWGVTNTGTATRHRDKFIVIYGVLFALSLNKRLRIRLNKIDKLINNLEEQDIDRQQ